MIQGKSLVKRAVRKGDISGRTVVQKVMQQCWWFLVILTISALITKAPGTELLSPPQNVFVDSVNMRHRLRWSPPVAECTTFIYSVQFQGEYELQVLKGKWVNAEACQQITFTKCDLTSDLASDSNYNLRVRAQCGEAVSYWKNLPKPFNRNQTMLTIPTMSVQVSGTSVHVNLSDLPPSTLDLFLTYWKNGEKMSTRRIPNEWWPYHITSLQEGATYCLSVQVKLPGSNKSTSTDKHCFQVADDSINWLTPVAVVFALALLVAMVLFLPWAMKHYWPSLFHNCWSTEPLPAALRDDLKDKMIYGVNLPAENTEDHHAILVLEPSQAAMMILPV